MFEQKLKYVIRCQAANEKGLTVLGDESYDGWIKK